MKLYTLDMTELLERFTREASSLRTTASSTLQNELKRMTAWDDLLTKNIMGSIGANVNTWLAHHPILNWLIHHPIISLLVISIAIILIIRLLLVIYRSVARMIDRLWLAVLRSPFWLIKLIFGWEIKSSANSTGTTITNYEITSNPEQLEVIMNRLEQIQQQQQQILEDIKYLKQQGSNLEAKQVNLQAIKQLKSVLPPDSLKNASK